MKTLLKLLLCLAAPLTGRSANLVASSTVFAPGTDAGPVNAVGAIVFATPGAYAATAWNVVGALRLAEPGDYTLVATTNSINLTGAISGPPSGRATLHLRYARALNVVGPTASNVTVIDDAQARPSDSKPAAPLTNLATRVTLAPGAVINVGFVIGEGPPQRVLVRAIGPGLTQFGVPRVLADPQLQVFRDAEPIAADDNGAADASRAAAGAFPVEPGGKDAAVLLTLSPGAYTVAIGATTPTDGGEVLAEVYLVP